MAARMPPALIAEVEAWAAANDATRSEALRRLVEISEGENEMKRKADFASPIGERSTNDPVLPVRLAPRRWSRGGLARMRCMARTSPASALEPTHRGAESEPRAIRRRHRVQGRRSRRYQ